MSYSRREVGFVDDLTHRLEKAGFNIWLDYRSLIPGTPWAEQINKGLNEADLTLFVVSKESIASPYVELEWRHALEHNKRVLLVLFEAVSLPPELQNLEWVDFRGGYESALKDLISRLNSPRPNEQPIPQSGFRAPFVIFLTTALALLSGVVSLFSFYTILLPWVLVPFAGRVLKRNFDYAQVQTTLWLQPVGLILGLGFFDSMQVIDDRIDAQVFFMYLLMIVSIVTSIALLMLLRSAALQRWGRPEANAPKFANPYKPNNPNPRPVRFYIDHAPQDRLIARHFSRGLVRYKHVPAADAQSAEAVFVLVSRFKTDTEANPETQVVFPVLVQTAQPSEKLSRVQWIDFRRGVRKLDAIAQLLPEPAKLLAALGVRPTNGAQAVLPNIIRATITFLTIMIMMSVASLPLYMVQVLYRWGRDILMSMLFPHLLNYGITIVMFVILSYFSIRALTERRGWLSSFWVFLFVQMALLALTIVQAVLFNGIEELLLLKQIDDEVAHPVTLMQPFLLMVGGVLLLGTYGLFQINTVRRWFPAAIVNLDIIRRWFPARAT